jgi:hypothetical protein
MSNDSGPKPIKQCLNSVDGISKVLKHASYISELNRQLHFKLPMALRALCQLANIRNDLVVLMCPSQLEASKVRMHSREILQIFTQKFKIPVKKIKIIIDLKPSS